MEASASPAACENAPAPGEGGAAAQVRQVQSLGSGESQAVGSDCSPASTDTPKTALGLRIQVWEAGFVSQTLPQRKAMDEERLRNFKELQAKFQKLDVPSLPGPIQFPASVSHKGDVGSTQSVRTWASGNPLSSDHSQPPPYPSGGEPQPLEAQKMQLAQRSEIQKCFNSPGPPGGFAYPAVNSQKASLLLDMNQANAKITNEKKLVVTSSFRNKLWNWEKVSSQSSEMSSAFRLADRGGRAFHPGDQKSTGLTIPEGPRKELQIKGSQTLPSQRHLMAQRKSCAKKTSSEDPTFPLSPHGRKSLERSHPERGPVGSTSRPIYERELAGWPPEKQLDVKHRQLPKTKPLPSVESLGPPPTKPPKPPAVNLQAFQRPTAAFPKSHREAVEEGYLPLESAELEEPHNYETTISYLRHSGNSINLCTAEEIADPTYEVGIEELQKPWKSFLHHELSPEREDDDKKIKEKEPDELKPQKRERDLPSGHLFEVGAYEKTPGQVPVMKVHRHMESVLARKQDAVTDTFRTKAYPKDPKLARHFQSQCGYVEALEVTAGTPGQRPFKPSSTSEETYDDVEYPGRKGSRSDFSSSFVSDSEENSKEMYEDVYKTKSNSTKIDLDGKALKRLQRFFKKEKDRFKMKTTKLKENVSAFSISLPNLELRSQEVIIHHDVNISEKESKDEDKVKIWKPKLFKPKGKKGAEESERLSPGNFFRTKQQNLEKDRTEREKLFRERFEYDKEITVINTAVACSWNSRKGTFDLPITPGEELEVIDIAEENLVICRNSKGKYGHVLIEHLNFKHQGWSP
ncbi:FYN-binding protein 2 isoform X2 [Artibeus jamaicensis]|uniref:FYN-binding protein 2 isoform X2 n=1 Tax=Artibeus jamaicensis TaxID=9417 RepID=UPI00235A59B8|nr:FYN-binding protein 2 isoform X2 [Artibeus jamaicensis]